MVIKWVMNKKFKGGDWVEGRSKFGQVGGHFQVVLGLIVAVNGEEIRNKRVE